MERVMTSNESCNMFNLHWLITEMHDQIKTMKLQKNTVDFILLVIKI